jgi:glycosyltransferase involved in cell wall biosynthesis
LFQPHWDAIGTPRQPPTLGPIAIEEQLRAGLQPTADGRDLACVILSFKSQPGLVAAVESILSQDVPVEIAVINSGGGDAPEELRSRGIQVEVINRSEPLYVGAARNLGIAATRAPYVSFLAADCLAEPGWAQGRLREHRAGALAVSSAVTNAHPDSNCAWAAYCLLHGSRMPGFAPQFVSHHGLSYARTIFEQFGTFREDLRVGEDTEFNARFRGMFPIAWAPDVRTAHRYPTTFPSLIADQFARGRQAAKALEELTGIRHDWIVAGEMLKTAPYHWERSWRASTSAVRRRLLGALPLVPPAALAYSLGALFSRRGRRRGRARGRVRILALLQCRNEMRYLPGYFENVPPQVDGVIALDDGSVDGSAEFMAAQPSVLQLIRKPPAEPHVWDEPGNRRLLIEAALGHRPDWLVAVDADERLERTFRGRAEAAIERAERERHAACFVKLHELWDGADTYRADGLWGSKLRARLFKASHDHELDERRLHGEWASEGSSSNRSLPRPDLVIYHLRMIDATDRSARQAPHVELDPDRRWQAVGYEYLTDETGLRLKRIPRGRGYR